MSANPLPGLPLHTLSDGLDLTALRRADRAVEDAAARASTAALRERLADAVGALDPALHPLADLLLAEIGRVDARAEAAAQAALEMRRTRGEWISLDPLRYVPGNRAAPPPAPPLRVVLAAGDPSFRGFGWHAAEGSTEDSWRWSGTERAASVILPSLGGGGLTIRLDLVAPFERTVNPLALTVLANGEPLDFEASGMDGSRAALTARWTAPEDGGQGSLVLILLGPTYTDPGGRDPRSLGVGLRCVSVDRD